MAEFTGRATSPATYSVDASGVADLVKAVKQNTDKNKLQRLMRKGFADAAEPFSDDILAVIPQALPSGGGLGMVIQSSTRVTMVANTGRWAGLWVKLQAKGQKKYRDLRALLGSGVFRHPVFGGDWPDRHPTTRAVWPWVPQSRGTNPALITGAIKDAAPQMRTAAEEVLANIAAQIEKE